MPQICIELSEKQAKLLKIVGPVELTDDIGLAKQMILEGLTWRVEHIETQKQDKLEAMLYNWSEEKERE
jgi:hypothetical protein